MVDFAIIRDVDSGPVAGTARNSEAGEHVIVEVADIDEATARELQTDPTIKAIAPSMPLTLHKPAPEPELDSSSLDATWGVDAVGAPDCPYSGKDVSVAVLDTGIDSAHPAFSGVTIVERNFTTESDTDSNGHGTHCAGTIFGRSVEGKRIGVAPGIERAIIGKVLGSGGGSTHSLIVAMQWALAEGANVISMSLGFDFPRVSASLIAAGWPPDLATSKALQTYQANVALFASFAEFARLIGPFAQPCLIVAASGNESKRKTHQDYEIGAAPPSASDGIHAVGALSQGQNGYVVAPFSNTNVAISAPGVGVLSAKAGGGLVSLSGTSMAAPHVAGVAALWAQKELLTTGSISGAVLRDRLLGSGSTANLDVSAKPAQVGTGIVAAPG